jgi:chemotaxis protein CheZ
MNDAAVATHDTPDLEALFDSIVEANDRAARGSGGNGHAATGGAAEKVIREVGQLTRTLHDSLRALGYDTLLQDAAATIPDARDRLAYIGTLTERAAERALNAVEVARPIQESLGRDAERLACGWERLFSRELGVDEFRALVIDTRAYLSAMPERTRATNAQLTEIMMAQDFQDLTGQVIKRVTEVAQDVERKLVNLLVENMPAERRVEARGLLNGPVVNPAGRRDVVTSQDQVDELLESLGF